MIRFCSAKINLGLRVGEIQPNGFHPIQSIFLPMPWYDAIEAFEAPAGSPPIALTVFGNQVEGKAEDNLIWKAHALLAERFTLPPIQVYLLKTIPSGAGMGGGSSDGANMLLLLNDLFNLGLTSEQLLKLAAQLGSDCPFFIYSKPAFVTGRGEHIRLISLNLADIYYCIVHPKIHVSTRVAFSWLDQQPRLSLAAMTAVEFDVKSDEKSEWKITAVNDFEGAVFSMHPEIAAIKAKLYQSGAFYASLTGSGSAVYGLFTEPISGDGFGAEHEVRVGKLN